MSGQTIVKIQKEIFDPVQECLPLTQDRKDLGALVTFTGLCRDEGGVLQSLEIEHYPGMAEEEIGRIITEARRRWPIEDVVVIHRFGMITPGEPIVLVAATGLHRAEAFEATNFLMDFLKTEAPFWKKQHLHVDGAGGWVSAKQEDEAAAQKWLQTQSPS
ncbi:molybdenum cofactor biosynthesis protein MoaE [Beijerinckia indica]|uniref:Molybdopterin synthase catalytic subunit n=1 Tax=Beijerinckia indica subsp. indica (strain ATCC 9039 / DSM 1715 / NCIMB 8712) TaxID=395963 RepID=B2ICS1_BEII9|nr:molybdenum cofactor biosynthesis protein MoaE [Beijerinckia indica]ACB95345.1 molybdopterin biosynthesis MoaE protein [Beijerinckia indica subsp. indica ATCC 9039]